MMMKLGRGASITVDECLTSDCSRHENGLDGICHRLDGIFRKSVIDRQHDAAFAKPACYRQWRFRPQASGGKCLFAIDFRRSEEHTSELQSIMRISYAVFCLQK